MEPHMFDNERFISRATAALAALECGPKPEDLAQAPLAELWIALVKDGTDLPVLWGYVTGHPLLGDRFIRTSPLIGLSREAGWARTFSRWYRLGEPFPIWKAQLATRLEDPIKEIGLLRWGSTGYGAIVDTAFLEAKMANVIALLKNPDAAGS
ncbi:ATP-dependent Lon protease [Paracoccus aestuarii]|uniref:ATP-dependent Lon protease n=2 Tax=Paracoccus aestuarii TaxID=453842 RepID=A0A418ZZW1_9RHOB|nr:ATP-dependent Lon protease [Paracoccus aestuarii]